MDKKLLILIVLSLLVFSANIGGTSIYILDEAKNAGCAMELHQKSGWIVPTFNDELRFDKPPLHYFFMKAAFSVFGINPFAARIFSSLIGVLLIVVIYFFGKKNINSKATFYSCLILIASLQVAFQFHLAVPDPYLIFFCTTGLLCFYEGTKTGHIHYYYLCYISLALATLAKGPVALALPGLTGLLFLLFQRKFTWQQLKQMHLLQGFVVFVLIAMPWYVLVHRATDGVWTEQFFFKHNFNRYASTMEGHGGFPFASLVIALAALMPFTFFSPQMIRMVWKKQRKNSFLQFCLTAFLVIVFFFTLSRTILPSYVGPSLPFLALLLGYYFDVVIRKKRFKNLWINAAVYAVIATAIPIALYFALQQEKELASKAGIAGWFVLLPIAAVVALVYITKGKIKEAFHTYVAGSVILLLLFFYFLYPIVDAQNPVNKSLAVVPDHTKINAYYGDFNPAYVFVLKHSLKGLNSSQEVKNYLQQNPESFIVSQQKYWNELNDSTVMKRYEGKDLFENPTTILVGTKKEQ